MEPRAKWGVAFVGPFCLFNSSWFVWRERFFPNFLLEERIDLKHSWPFFFFFPWPFQSVPSLTSRWRGLLVHQKCWSAWFGSSILVPGRKAQCQQVLGGELRWAALCAHPWHPTGMWDVFISSPRTVGCYVLQRFFFHKWHRPLLMSIIKFWTKCCPRYNCLLWRSFEIISLEFISFWHFRNVFLDWRVTPSKTCCHFKLITLIPKHGRWECLSFWNLASVVCLFGTPRDLFPPQLQPLWVSSAVFSFPFIWKKLSVG